MVWLFLAGATATVLVVCACIVAGRADREAEAILRAWRGR